MSGIAFSRAGDTLAVSASNTSASGALPGTSGVPGTIRVANGSPYVAFFRTGTVGLTAVTTDTYILSGSTEVFSIPADHTHFAVILTSGTGTVYAQRGGGF